jgi:hypothetical protein
MLHLGAQDLGDLGPKEALRFLRLGARGLGRLDPESVQTCGEAIEARRAATQRPMAVDKRINVPVLEFLIPLSPLILLGRSSNAGAAPAVSARSAPIAIVSNLVG